jgi:hypothetical protein
MSNHSKRAELQEREYADPNYDPMESETGQRLKAERELGSKFRGEDIIRDHCADDDEMYVFNLRKLMDRHLSAVEVLTEGVLREVDSKTARYLAELSRSNATAAMACAVALTGTPLTNISIEGTGQ